MPNMSYCRFQNTLNDLRDCYNCGMEALDYTPEAKKRVEKTGMETLSKDETEARLSLIALCSSIADEYGHLVDTAKRKI